MHLHSLTLTLTTHGEVRVVAVAPPETHNYWRSLRRLNVRRQLASMARIVVRTALLFSKSLLNESVSRIYDEPGAA